jgi:hypothetical protein
MTCALTAAWVTLLRRRRRQALELILEGREKLPIAAVEEQRARLLEPRHRETLAASFEDLAGAALSPDSWPPAYVFECSTVASVAHELRDVGALLRSGPTTARGVALARRLLTDGVHSPLYRDEPTALSHELRRIRFLLASHL